MAVEFSASPNWGLVHGLQGPVGDFLARPRKNLRGEVIKAGFLLYHESLNIPLYQKDLSILSEILEWIHSGSLIIDDIQDNSIDRRGKECLHRIYGLPCALNAANWMYFEAINRINNLSVDELIKLQMINLTLDMMSKAHQGQAIDIMTNISNIPREKIYDLGLLSHDLKTGSLFSLALQLGALLANKDVDLVMLSNIGIMIGRSLQRFDDLSNFNVDDYSSKSLEDLQLGRPSWPWMYLAKYRSEEDFEYFKKVVAQLPNREPLKVYLRETNLRNDALDLAITFHHDTARSLESSCGGLLNDEGITSIIKILERVMYAYV